MLLAGQVNRVRAATLLLDPSIGLWCLAHAAGCQDTDGSGGAGGNGGGGSGGTNGAPIEVLETVPPDMESDVGNSELIETDDDGNALTPQVAIDPNGNAVAVWVQSSGTRVNVWANRLVEERGWGAAEPIEVDNLGDAFDPHLAVGPNDCAIAVWSQSDGTVDNLWANRFE